ncbi:MAG TPA: GDP-mannose 4,6-dehydratase [Candidatus Sulfotelmatobacter sp.]|nr:GDP-mannose 4,6-dehydratase [Candidatus Sulfotelmatobacter sp.]
MRKQETRSVTIFGGAGFIGSNLAHFLLTRTDAKVHVFDNLSRAGVHHNLEWLKKAAGNSGRLQVTVGDVRNPQQVEKAVAYATDIYHLAAQVAVTTSVADPRLDFEVNLAGTFNVLDAARRSGNKPFILFTSTNKVYGELGAGTPVIHGKRYMIPAHRGTSESQPLDFHSPYGCSKGAADQYVRDFGRIYDMPTVVFRMSCIAGPRQFGTEDQGWVAHFVYSALRNDSVVIYGDGHQVRDVLCVHDLIRAFEAARQNLETTGTNVYNIGGGQGNTTSLLELIDQIELLTGRRLECVADERRVGDQFIYVTDIGKIERDTGWKPEIGLPQTIQLLQEFWEENQAVLANRRRAGAPTSALSTFDLVTELSGRAG